MERNLAKRLWAPKLKLDLFKQQKEFINDKSKLKAALCSRRAGKTHCGGAYLALTAVKRPGTISVYIALTRKSAKRIMWGTLKEIFIKSGCYTGTKWNNSELVVELPNGSQIYLTGASDEDDKETLRGNKYALVLVDECASFKSHFQEMLDEVIEPALIDLNGTLALLGTPSAACVGHFYDATTSSDLGYSVHHWTIHDNPFIPNARGWLENRMLQKKWTKNHPVYLREWCGRWVKSADSLVYKFDENKNTYKRSERPQELYFVLGVDFGWDDKNAFCVVGFHPKEPHVYVCETYAKGEMLIEQTAQKIKDLQAFYGGFVKMVVDTGGLGKQISQELIARHSLAVEPADKLGKQAFIELVNSDFNEEKVKVPIDDRSFIDEMHLLQWDESKPGKRCEDSRFENHRCDAFLYAYKEAKHYLFRPEPKKPLPGSKADLDAKEKALVEQRQRSVMGQEKPWWEKL